MYTILMVDDDPAVLNANSAYFSQKGYKVFCVGTAEDAEKIISSAALDCVVLDVDLPGENGFSLCVRIRKKTGLPVVFLSGFSEEQSRIRGLSIGGDDYVCKPYSLEELELRVRARINSGRMARQPKELCFGGLSIIPANRSVSYGEALYELPVNEFDLLYFLAMRPLQIFSQEQLFDQIWKSPVNRGAKALQMTVVRLRQKLFLLNPEHEYIQTVRRKGYLFVPPAKAAD